MRAIWPGRLVRALVGLLLCLSASAQNPLWTLDLKSSAAYRAASVDSLRQSKKIVILDDGDVLVLLSSLHKDSSSALLLLIDGANGATKKSLVLGKFPGAMMIGDGFDVLPMSGSRFLLEIRNELRLGRAPQLDFEVTRLLPSARGKDPAAANAKSRRGSRGEEGDHWSLKASPSLRKIQLTRHAGDSRQQFQIDSNTLDASVVQPEDSVGLLDQGTLSLEAALGGDVLSFRVMIRESNEAPSRILCDYDCHLLGVFGPDLIGLRDFDYKLKMGKLSVVDRKGHIFYRDTLNITRSAFAGASRAPRAAFSYNRNNSLGLRVIDADQGPPVMDLQLDEGRPQGLRDMVDLAIAPDGKRLALVRDNALRYFAVP